MARLFLAAVILFVGFVFAPATAKAASCMGTFSSARNLQFSDLVFVGRVIRVREPQRVMRPSPPGSSIGGLILDPRIVILEPDHVYRGDTNGHVVIRWPYGASGLPLFKEGETWLVYADMRSGRVETSVCTRTRRVDEAIASMDIAYLEGHESGRQQGIVWGNVLRRIVGPESTWAYQALFEPLQVVAEGPAGRFEVTTDKWGPYQLVLPPGDFVLWVERAGQPVSVRRPVHVEHASDARTPLVADYED